MRLGNIETFREALGGRDKEGNLFIGRSYASALKAAAGLKGSKYFDIDAVIEWKKLHPNWKSTVPRSPKCNPIPRSRLGVPYPQN